MRTARRTNSTAKEEQENTCENCGRPLFGRIDKRFCNDHCRNTFNRQKAEREKQQAHNNLPEIFQIIRNNYDLLLSLGPLDPETFILLKERDLVREGFNPKFFTSIHQDSDGLWKYCFERGWLDEGGKSIHIIKDRHEQASLK